METDDIHNLWGWLRGGLGLDGGGLVLLVDDEGQEHAPRQEAGVDEEHAQVGRHIQVVDRRNCFGWERCQWVQTWFEFEEWTRMHTNQSTGYFVYLHGIQIFQLLVMTYLWWIEKRWWHVC